MADEIQSTNQAALLVAKNIQQWHAWLDRRAAAGEISHTTAAAYKRGMSKFQKWGEQAHTLAISGNQPETIADIVRDWKASLIDANYKARSINAWLAGVKAFYAWYSETYSVPNPIQSVKGASRKGQTRTHVREALTDDEVNRLLALDMPARDKALISLMVYAAIRTVEAHRADLSDVRNHRLYIQGKRHVEITDYVVLNSHAETALNVWLVERGEKPGALFTSNSNKSKGERLSLPAIRQIIKGYFRQAGIRGNKTVHSLRHSAITKAALMAAKHGKTISSVMSMSRHKNEATLSIYLHDLERETDPIENYIEY